MSQSGGLTDVDLVNMALSELNVNTITSFGDGSKAGRLAQVWYKPALRAMLRAHPWNFARAWLVLPQTTMPESLSFWPDPEFNTEIIFTSAYQLPPDCIRAFRASPYQYHFRIVGRLLLTDAPAADFGNSAFVGAQPGVGLPPLNQTTQPNQVGIEYITDSKDLSDFDPMFLEAFALKLASHLAYPLTGQTPLSQDLAKRCATATLEAWFVDGAENWDDALYNNIFTDVRNPVGFEAGSEPF